MAAANQTMALRGLLGSSLRIIWQVHWGGEEWIDVNEVESEALEEGWLGGIRNLSIIGWEEHIFRLHGTEAFVTAPVLRQHNPMTGSSRNLRRVLVLAVMEVYRINSDTSEGF